MLGIGSEVAPRISPAKHGVVEALRVRFDDGTAKAYLKEDNLVLWTPPAPPPPPSTLPNMITPTWRGDMAAGDWSQWDGVPGHHVDGRDQDFAIVSSPGPIPPGLVHAWEITLTALSKTSAAGQRGLLTLWPNGTTGKTRAVQGLDSWYRHRLYFPSDFVPAPDTDWNWLYELHNYPDGAADAQLALSVVMDTSDHGGVANGERLSCRIMGGGSPAHPADNYGSGNIGSNPDVRKHWFVGPKIQRGHWYDLVWRMRWDYRLIENGGQGLAEMWIDGVKIGSYSGPTLYYYASRSGPGEAYLQAGYYRDDDPNHPNSTVYHAGSEIGAVQ